MEDSKVIPKRVVRLATTILVLKMISTAMVAIITREGRKDAKKWQKISEIYSYGKANNRDLKLHLFGT